VTWFGLTLATLGWLGLSWFAWGALTEIETLDEEQTGET
jgi:hypothetical protein